MDAPGQHESRAAGRLLVVDDSPSALQLIQAVLEEGGFFVVAARSGEEALERFREAVPDLVVLDIVMPVMDGLETCRRMRAMEQGRALPILFLTGDARGQTQLDAIDAGGDDLIYKPALQTELLIRVRSLLRIQRLQKDLQHERDLLLVAQQHQERLFQFIIHDLKNPLQAIQSTVDLLSLKALPQGAAEYLGRLNETSRSMGRMIQDLLDVSRSERAGLEPCEGLFSLGSATLARWLKDLEGGLARKVQHVHLEADEDLTAFGDEELIRRCVLNLVGNASKYGPEGGMIRVAARREGQQYVLQVEDEGPGVPEAMREVIFEPFTRLERERDTARSSSGLGLAFARVVAQAHHGCIWVEHREPHGARFCLTWPTGQPL